MIGQLIEAERSKYLVNSHYDLIVIGAGAAGLMASIQAGERGLKVLLLEKGEKAGRKILISGGGRCNITNNKYSEIKDFLQNYPRGSKFLWGLFSKFNHIDTINWFESHNLKTKTEEDGRVFPITDNSADVLNTLLKACQQAKVEILYKQNVKDLLIKDQSVFGIVLQNETIIYARNILVSCGGMSYQKTGSTGDAYEWAIKAGHKVIKAKPSLTGYLSPDAWIHNLKGLTLPNIKLSLYQNSKKIAEHSGGLLFTHWGITGPGIFKISSLAAGQDYNSDIYTLYLNLLPDLTREDLENLLKEKWKNNARKKVINCLEGICLERLKNEILLQIGINTQKTLSEISKKELNQIIESLMKLKINITGIRPSGEEIVTAGGIELNEINSNTMQSKIINGLYWAGEVLNIDGFTGGFNLQSAWTTGWIAGNSV